MSTKLAGTLFGAATIALMAGSTFAQGIYTLEVHDGDFAGRAYPGEEQRRNNQDQEGAGMEHVRCNLIPNAPGGARVMCVGTGSYTNIPGSPVNDRIQVLCSSHRLDAQMGLVQTGLKYITNNRGDEYQNGHAPVLAPAFGGTMAVAYYNYDPDNNTKLWGKVLGPDCEEMSPQTLLLAKQNDDVLGHASNPIVVADAAGETRFGSCGIGNGNGRDDMWCIGVRATKTGDTYALQTYFDRSVEAEEERSRPSVNESPIADTIFECAAVGNAQPPNRGMRCALISTDPNTPNDQRVIYRRYIQERQGNIYATTPAVAAVRGPDGKVTGDYIVTYVEVDTSNRQGRSKGRTLLRTIPVRLGPTDLEFLDTPRNDMVGAGDQAHQAACDGQWGPEGKAMAFILQGSVVGSVTGVGRINMLSLDTTTRRAVEEDAIVYADSTDTGWISQYYGNNPNTPQGRNHHFCMMVPNPGYGVTGAFQPTVKSFLMVSNTGRKLRTTGVAQDKMAFDLVLIPAVVPAEAPQPDPEPDPDPDPSPDPTPDPTDDPNDSGAQIGGCSTGGTTSTGGLLLLGLAVAFTIRRRRAE